MHLPKIELIITTTVMGLGAAATIALAHGTIGTTAVAAAVELPAGDWGTFASILGRNVAVALGLFSGVVSLGVSTGVFLLMVGAMLGWSVAFSIEALGFAETLLRCWAYTPLEVAGFAVAGAAGLMPAIDGIRRLEGDRCPGSLARSLRLLGLAIVLLTLAAAVETASISLTSQRLSIP